VRMERREPPPKREFKPVPPKWSSPLWYLPFMLILLWFWQSAIVQLAYRTIPYSEFKERLRNGEVVECTVQESIIDGKIQPKLPPSSTNAPPSQTTATKQKELLFRTVRVEDPSLVSELEKAGVKFHGERPSILSQMLLQPPPRKRGRIHSQFWQKPRSAGCRERNRCGFQGRGGVRRGEV